MVGSNAAAFVACKGAAATFYSLMTYLLLATCFLLPTFLLPTIWFCLLKNLLPTTYYLPPTTPQSQLTTHHFPTFPSSYCLLIASRFLHVLLLATSRLPTCYLTPSYLHVAAWKGEASAAKQLLEYYVLRATYNILLITYCSPLTTHHLLLTSYHLLLVTYYLLPTTYYLLLTSYYLHLTT